MIRQLPEYRTSWGVSRGQLGATASCPQVPFEEIPVVERTITLGLDSTDVLVDLLCPLVDRGYCVQVTLNGGQRQDHELWGYTSVELLLKDWCDATGGGGPVYPLPLSQIVAIHIY